MPAQEILDDGSWLCDCGHANIEDDDECYSCGRYWE